MESFEERLKRIESEKSEIQRRENAMRDEAIDQLEQVNAQLEELEQRKSMLEEFLGIDDTEQRAAHGQIQQLCISALGANAGGLSSGEIKDWIEKENSGVNVRSVPSTLSRMASLGRVVRDEFGRYRLA